MKKNGMNGMKKFEGYKYYKYNFKGGETNYYKIKGTIISGLNRLAMVCDIIDIDRNEIIKNIYFELSGFFDDSRGLIKITEKEWDKKYEELHKTSIL